MSKSAFVDISGDGGVLKQTVKEGTGEQAKAGQRAWVHYIGWHKGEEFDASRPKQHRQDGLDFIIHDGGVIQGWHIAVATMKVGERANVKLQPAYAYGTQGIGPIPPNAVLDFDMELLRLT
eukprot:GEMP01107467.1.p1 GENE.GEMP01107467.1~~GEMP01107467.1.p1  ORF type:complete len:121 (+),score=26.78 GEMP01107467.1:50-412(+)